MSAPYYQDEHVTLYLGDCREVSEWTAADVLITDPPYGVGYSAKRGGTGRRSKGHTPLPIAGDHDFTTAAGAVCMWGEKPMAVFASHASLPATLDAVRQHLSRVRVMTWWKSNVNGGTPGNPWMADVEFAVCGVREWPKRALSALVSAPRNVGNPHWQGGNAEAYLHPTQKPLSVMWHLCDAMPDGVIADPFAGSGSTLVAAKRMGRKAVGVELDEGYCEVIANRLDQPVLDLEGTA